MKVSDILFVVVIIILVISSLCIWLYPSTRDFMASNIMWNGTKDFSNEFSAINIDSLDDLPDLPEQVVVVAIPYLQYTDEELLRIRRYIEDGGTLLLMDDFGYGNDVLSYLGLDARFINKPLLDPLFNYKSQSLPRITDFTSAVKDYNVNTIVFNHATTLTGVVDSEVIASSSSYSFLDTNENDLWDDDESKGPFPVAAEFRLGEGRVELVADPSIMLNTMVGRDDNYSFLRYLIYRDEQNRILIDRSHLPQTPLDASKASLASARDVLSTPYALLGVTAAVFMAVSRYTLKKGETGGK